MTCPTLYSDSIPLVLGGGGMKGPLHTGLLKAMEKMGMKPGKILGVSIGSFVGSAYANGIPPDEILEILRRDVLDDPRVQISQRINGLEVVRDIVARHRLKTQPNLRILALSVTQRQPVVFEGDYDLATAIAASTAIPMLVQTVQTKEFGKCVDGALWHPNPGNFSEPGIVSKLPYAMELPDDLKGKMERFFHRCEMTYGRLTEHWYKDPKGHLVIGYDTKDVGTLNFSISLSKMRRLSEQAYSHTSRLLEAAVADGRIVMR